MNRCVSGIQSATLDSTLRVLIIRHIEPLQPRQIYMNSVNVRAIISKIKYAIGHSSRIVYSHVGLPIEFGRNYGKSTPTEHPYTFTLRE